MSRDDNPADRNTNRVYYQRDGIRVTRDYLFVSGRRFSLSGVTDLRTVQSRTAAPELWWGFLGGNLAIVVAGWPVAHWAVFGLNTAASAVFVIVLLRRRAVRRNELWASYRGQDTRLLVMRDSERYGQVCRALLRAREARRPGPEQAACRVVA